MTPTCATCQHWDELDDYPAGVCQLGVRFAHSLVLYPPQEHFGCTLHANTAAQGAASREEPGLCTCEAAWTCPTCRAEDDYVPPTPPQETP